MKTLKLSEASRSLAEYASELTDDIVLVTERNKPVAAVVSLKNVDREVLALSRSPQFLKIIDRSRREFAAGRRHTLAEVRDLLGVRRRADQPRQRRRKKAARG
jgi:PHD/YefM family antitoxin component YafN of YafNO toxin-antitoxin module